MAHSIYTRSAVAFVEEHQGCCKYDLAAHLTYSSRRGVSKQYYLVNTQIRLGNIVAIRKGNRYELYTPEFLEAKAAAKAAAAAAAAEVGLDPSTPEEIVSEARKEAGLSPM